MAAASNKWASLFCGRPCDKSRDVLGPLILGNSHEALGLTQNHCTSKASGSTYINRYTSKALPTAEGFRGSIAEGFDVRGL